MAGRRLRIDGVLYSPMKVELMDTRKRAESTNQWLEVTCTEGKNRQVRRVLQHFGLTVTRLMRVSYGDYQLQNIPPGLAVEVPVKPIERQKKRGPLFEHKMTKRKAAKGPTSAADESSENDSSSPAVQWVRSL